MKPVKRILCLMLSVLMLCTLLPQPLRAAQTVYFTSVNDMLLDLNDETMPFWQGNALYVSSAAFDRTDLGTTYSRSRDKTTAIIYKNRDVLVFDIAAGTMEDNRTHEKQSGVIAVRGDAVFFSVSAVARFFGFDYSCTKVDYGYLVRIKDEDVVLDDSTFIDAALVPMGQRYNQYEKSHQEIAPTVSENGKDTGGKHGTAYLLCSVSDEQVTGSILQSLLANGASAAFLFSPQELSQMPELLRRVEMSGSCVVLKIDADRKAEQTLSTIQQANELLWAAGNMKTRLVFLTNATEAVTSAVIAAGYCPITADLDYSGQHPSSTRVVNRIQTLADRESRCIAYLGEDAAVQALFRSALPSLRSGGCTIARINEVAVRL